MSRELLNAARYLRPALPFRPARLPPRGRANLLRLRAGAAHTQHVLTEFVALALARGAPRAGALDFVADLQDDAEVEVVWVDEALHRESLELLRARPDKDWSLCDAVSILLMRQRSLADALTTDHHFEQAGLRRLLPA